MKMFFAIENNMNGALVDQLNNINGTKIDVNQVLLLKR